MWLKCACFVFVVAIMLCAATVGMAEEKQQTGIIVAAFGSTVPEAVSSIEKFASSLEQDFADSKIITAFISSQILYDIDDREPEIPSLARAVEIGRAHV